MAKIKEKMNGWRTVRLGDIIDLKYGFGLTAQNRTHGSVPVYGSSGVVGFHDVPATHGPGIVVGRKGNVGAVYYSKVPFYPIDTVYFIDDTKQPADFHFLFYLLSRVPFKQIGSDVGVPGINRDLAYQLEVSIPENIEDQKRIASILSAFDDKIENNNRIIKTLEDMAQAIFKEWFVKNAKVKMQNAKLSEFAHITMGQSPSSQHYNERGVGQPFHQGVTNFGERFPVHKVFSTAGEKEAKEGDVLLSVRAPVGRINLANTQIVLGRGLAAIQHKHNKQSFLFYSLKRIFAKLDSMGSGSVFPAVTKKELEELVIAVPDDKFVDDYEQRVSLMDRKIKNLIEENQKLAAMRDLLLPRLMSGELNV